MRDPIMRAFSEWSMFALGWEWEPTRNFSRAFAPKLAQLRECNETLFQNVTALRALPTDQLLKYGRPDLPRSAPRPPHAARTSAGTCAIASRAARRCAAPQPRAHLAARAPAAPTTARPPRAQMMYPQTSMYAVCLEHALRYFPREQFLFLRYEDLMRMDARAILRLISRFTGLYLDERVLKAAEREGKCQPHSKLRGRPMSYSSHSADAAEFLAEAAAPLERFFSPYNALLAELIHPDFRWHHSDHVKRRLNATEKAAQRKWEDEVRELKKQRHDKKKQNILKLARQSVAWLNATSNASTSRTAGGRGGRAAGVTRGRVGRAGR